MKILFIGNSATYVHAVPTMLEKLARGAGIDVTTAQITPGGYTLAQHADGETEHGKAVLAEIARGYDAVFLQDNSNCIEDEEHRAACRAACGTLAARIKKSGAALYFYVRPPREAEKFGYDSIGQCRALDLLFSVIAADLGGTCAFVNRAFAYVIAHLDVDLWGPDRAHTSPEGAFLVAATIFATLFDTPATSLGTVESIDQTVARKLLAVAEKIVHGGVIPWENT